MSDKLQFVARLRQAKACRTLFRRPFRCCQSGDESPHSKATISYRNPVNHV